MKDRRVPKEAHVEKTTKTELWPPEPTMQRPAVFGECGRTPALTHLHYADPITFLDQAVRADTAAEPGADHDEIKVEFVVVARHALSVNRIHLFNAFW